MAPDKEFITADFYLAAYLKATGNNCLLRKQGDSKRRSFVFPVSEGGSLFTKAQDYYSGTATVSAVVYAEQLKTLKDMIYLDRSQAVSITRSIGRERFIEQENKG